MIIWLEDTFGPDNAIYIFWAGVIVLALAALLVLWRLVRARRSGVYIAGGRNRKARLAVMDATPIDAHRSLVLVRRDEVEHLILIGGNSDLVIEPDIRAGLAARRPPPDLQIEEPKAHAPPPPPAQQPAPRPQPPAPPVLKEPPPPRPAPPAATPVVAAPPRPPAPNEMLDDDLMRELETALDIEPPSPRAETPAPRPEPLRRPSLDEEMARLLGELTPPKR